MKDMKRKEPHMKEKDTQEMSRGNARRNSSK